MEKDFVHYAEALVLKELGFDEPCFAFFWNTGKFYTCGDYPHTISYHTQNQLGDYNLDSTSAPLYQQAFRWFREKHNLHSTIIITSMQNYGYLIEEPQVPYHIDQLISYKTYEEAEVECLKKLIEIRQSQKTSDESPDTRTFRTPSSDYNSRGQYRK